jgi:hypothetical protein
MFDTASLWIVGVGAIAFGIALIVVAVAIAIFAVDWKALREARAAKSDKATAP